MPNSASAPRRFRAAPATPTARRWPMPRSRRSPSARRWTGSSRALDAEVGQSKAAGAVLGQVNSADRFKLTAAGGRILSGPGESGAGDPVHHRRPRISRPRWRRSIRKSPTAPSRWISISTARRPRHPCRPGDRPEAWSWAGPAQAVMLPNGPFYQDTGGNWVFVVAPDGGYAVKRNVRLGRRNPAIRRSGGRAYARARR